MFVIVLLLGLLNVEATIQGTCDPVLTGPNFAGQNLTDYNFASFPKDSLVGANFQNAVLNGAQFQNLNLTNADFSGASLLSSAKSIVDLSGTTLDHTKFVGAKMDSSNLQFASFQGADFSRASLLSTDFGPVMTILPSTDGCRTKFDSTILDFDHFPIKEWPQLYWSYTDLSYARISGLNDKNFSFNGKNISGALLQGMNFSHFDFTNCVMTGADLTNATLDYAIMNGSQMDQVNMTGASLKFVQMIKAKLYNPANASKGANLSGAVLNNSSMTGSDFSFASMHGTSLIGVTADSCIFNNASFQSDAVNSVADFSGADLSYSTFQAAALNGVNMSDTYIIDGQFNNATMAGTVFSQATMPGANFNASILQGVSFTGAILQGANFTGSTLTSFPGNGSLVDFTCAQLGGANFSNAAVTDVNFAFAVMPTADLCCTTQTGEVFCGVIAINQLAYGGTILPKPTKKINCPNGDLAICAGAQWTIPNWTTKSCNQNRNTERVWIKPNCSAKDTTGIVRFKDPNLKACLVRQIFHGDSSKVINKKVAVNGISVSCPGKGISDLGGLEYFTNLQELDVSGNELTDANFFFQHKFSGLTKLKIGANQLTGLNLNGCGQINYVDASQNQLTSVAFDAGSYLNFIDLSYNQLTSLDLSAQNLLNYVDLSNNKLTSVAAPGAIDRMSGLTTLYLQNNSLSTIGDIGKLYNGGNGNFYSLNLSCNLPFKCNTLGLDSTSGDRNFLKQAQCGVNNLPGCGTPIDR